MKIISKFKDYYDGCNPSHDIATGLYNRKQEEILVDWVGLYSSRINGKHPYELKTGIIGFCGKLYPYIKYTTNSPSAFTGENKSVKYIYSFEEFNTLRIKLEATEEKNSRYRWGGYDDIFRSWKGKDKGKLWFASQFSSFIEKARKHNYSGINPVYVNPKDLFLKYKVPYFVLEDYSPHPEDIKRGKYKLTLNPCLQDYKFYKIFDAYSAYQEVEMFLNNEIVRPDDPFIAPVDDKIKAESHGFNMKSFRREKGDKKRKGKSKSKRGK